MRKSLFVLITVFLIIISIVFALSLSSFVVFLNSQDQDKTALNNYIEKNTTDLSSDPKIKLTTIVDGLTNPWEIAFVDSNLFYYTQRTGEIRGHNLKTKENFCKGSRRRWLTWPSS